GWCQAHGWHSMGRRKLPSPHGLPCVGLLGLIMHSARLIWCTALVVALPLALTHPGDDNAKPGVAPTGPLSARDERATFRPPQGFKIELVASEPDIVDPVAMAFDENGRLFVAEMRAYPNAGIGTGLITSGRIVLLEDRDGDGFFEKSTVFADKLRLPTSV